MEDDIGTTVTIYLKKGIACDSGGMEIYMESEIIQLASDQGMWTVLSVILLFYIIRNQEKRDQKQDEREEKYQDLLQKLTEQLNMAKEMKEDIGDIKSYLVSYFKENAQNT